MTVTDIKRKDREFVVTVERDVIKEGFWNKIRWNPKTEKKVEQYFGSSTVWYRLPDFERASTSIEGWLCSQIEKARFEKRLP